MVWLALSELIPDARAAAPTRSVATVLALTFAALMALQAALLQF